VPDVAIGRLVETPGEMEALVRAFLAHDPRGVESAFVSGYDFLIDSADAISDTLGDAELGVTVLIDDDWTAEALRNRWLGSVNDLASVNAHFDHWQAIPAAGSSTLESGEVVAATADMSGTVNYSMGCHSGFSVHDAHAGGVHPLDFAQALAGRGAWWIGNTGYGYGMDDSVAYTERMMHLFTERVVSGGSVTVGEALRWAKNRYLGTVPSGGFGTYDEKAMIEATLYGLPMYSISTGTGPTAQEAVPVSATDLATETMTFELASQFQLETGSEYGDYYTIDGEVQVAPGRPVQPRTSAPVPVKMGQTPHGAVLVGGMSEEEEMDPLITRPVTDTTLGEPAFEAVAWFPSNPWGVNRQGEEAQLVVVPAQFQGDQGGGVQRRFTELEFQVYYTDTASTDFAPPVVWTVEGVALGNVADFRVVAEDTSGVQRVMMVYTRDGTNWHSRDLSYSTDRDLWETHFTELADPFIYFAQVVDGAGNVTVTSNKGLFFEPARNEIYLPLVVRNHT